MTTYPSNYGDANPEPFDVLTAARKTALDALRVQVMAQLHRCGAAARRWRRVSGQPDGFPSEATRAYSARADAATRRAHARWIAEWEALEQLARLVIPDDHPVWTMGQG